MLEKYFPLQNRSIETNLQESATSYNLTKALPYCPLHDHKND